jgi:hypothetical protein
VGDGDFILVVYHRKFVGKVQTFAMSVAALSRF